ncbi:MAG: hypothetical protein ACTS4V_01710 [Candidatus Hodgkinia cicadicola]
MLTSVGGSPRRLRFLTCQTSRRNVAIAPPCQLHGALAKTTTSPSKRPNHARTNLKAYIPAGDPSNLRLCAIKTTSTSGV